MLMMNGHRVLQGRLGSLICQTAGHPYIDDLGHLQNLSTTGLKLFHLVSNTRPDIFGMDTTEIGITGDLQDEPYRIKGIRAFQRSPYRLGGLDIAFLRQERRCVQMGRLIDDRGQ